MTRTAEQLRHDALRIWQAGVDAVAPERLLPAVIKRTGRWLEIDEGEPIDLATVGKIFVCGGGKAGAAMVGTIEKLLAPTAGDTFLLTGQVHVPHDCLRPTEHVRLIATRSAGSNEPTAAGVEATRAMVQAVAALDEGDLCLVLLSGGASALLPLPVDKVSLDDKRSTAQHLSAAGADIIALNTVRRAISQVKGGGLARTCNARTLVALIISDVLGDSLEMIGSGPTAPGTSSPREALAVLARFDPERQHVPASVYRYLESASQRSASPPTATVRNIIVGNNAVAVDAAGLEAERSGYSHAMVAARESEGLVEPIGVHLAEMGLHMRDTRGPDCLISGGEGVVQLAPAAKRGRGGRNTQLALAALQRLIDDPSHGTGIAIISGGTDGEDGPTDAAGAVVTAEVIQKAQQLGLDPADYLARNDAYSFFERCGGLIKTGPTNTNVCDLRVVLVERREL